MITQIISSKNCKICKGYLERLDKRDYNYIVYDADNPDNTKQLDEWKITDMPVVQIVDAGKVLHQFGAGPRNPKFINEKMSDLEKKS